MLWISEKDTAVAVFIVVAVWIRESTATCRVEECAQWFQKTKDYESLRPSSSIRYCEVLQTYLKCMNDTMIFCHGNLRFHSSELVMRRHWKDFNCSQWKEKKPETTVSSPINTCYFNPPSSHRKMKVCSLFGDPHLIRFDGNFETCSEEGARPLVDNRYFLVQVTNKNIRGEALTTTVSKVTVLIRKHNCTSALRYEASSDEQDLPRGFIDGSTFKKISERNSVELLWQETNYIEIALHFIHSSIHIRRQGPYISVTIRSPSNVLETGVVEADELCWSGCRKKSKIDIDSSFRRPKEFAQCYARRIHVPLKIAQDRCREIGTLDYFFDACVFDVMLSDDDYLVTLAKSAQTDFHRLAPQHIINRLAHNHRHQSQTKLAHIPLIFENCLTASFSFFHSSHLLAYFMFFMFVYLF